MPGTRPGMTEKGIDQANRKSFSCWLDWKSNDMLLDAGRQGRSNFQ
jgi:hypothetical protein